METMKCLDCGNTTKFIIPYIQRVLTTFNEQGDVIDDQIDSCQSYDDERILCGECEYDNLNIYSEGN